MVNSHMVCRTYCVSELLEENVERRSMKSKKLCKKEKRYEKIESKNHCISYGVIICFS